MRTPTLDIETEQLLADWRAKTAVADSEVEKTLQCTLITPMFGGGIDAGKVDRDLPIRAASLRGQLRFWWRIACGPASSSELFAREAAIWGGITKTAPIASKVRLQVLGPAAKSGDLISSNDYRDPGVKYAFGPAAIDGADWLKPGYGFQLQLRYPESVQEDVEAALRWWASFGGLGARTRRGFGAIAIDGLAPISKADVTAHGGLLAFSGSTSGDAQRAWKTGVTKLFEYRQGRGTGRRAGGGNTPGRSYWPEPDQLRRFTGKDANGRHEAEHDAGNVFPRSAFGMPIIFEFRGSPGDPHKTELLPDDPAIEREQDKPKRMASPLILRPYPQGREWQACALLLPGWQAALTQPLRLNEEINRRGQKTMVATDHEPAHWPTDPATRQRITDTIEPMNNNGQARADDPLSAFLHYFEN